MSIGQGRRARGGAYRPCAVVMTGVTESNEDFAVEIDRDEIIAFNEAGYKSTRVDLRQLIAWLRMERPELLR